MAKKLIVEIIGDATKLTRSFNQSTTAANKFGAEVSGSMGKAEKSFTKLQRVAAGGFIGAAAISAGIVALRKVVDVAAESQQVLGQTQVALESTGKSWSEYGATIEKAVAEQSRLGFDDEALLKSFSLFVRNAGSVEEALRRNNIAMDVARARFIDLEQAAALVNKAALGQAGALRRVGIDARTGASGVELLTQLERQFAGAAEDASTTAVGATDRLKVSLENVQETIGSALLPAITEMATVLSDAADGANLLAQNLRALGDVKIPVIDIPLNFKLPGTDSKVLDIGKEIAKQAGPYSFLFRAQQLANLFKDQPEPDTSGAAKMFDDRVDNFVEGLERARDGAVAKGNAKLKAFGEQGFKALKVNELGTKLQTQFDALLDSLDLKFDQATFADNTSGALAILDETEKAIRKRIATEGRTTALLRQLLEVQQQRAGIFDDLAAQRDQARRDRADAAKDAKQAAKDAKETAAAAAREAAEAQRRVREAAAKAAQRRQFRAIGLSATGGDIIPGVENLRKQFKQLSENPELANVPRKLRDRLALVGNALAGGVKGMKEPTREAINDLFRDIRATFGDESGKPLVPPRHVQLSDKILAALGFDQDIDTRKLQKFQATTSRLQPRVTTPTAAAGVGGVNINGPITVVADDPDAFLRDLQKKAARTTATARGRFPGRSLGLG